MSEQAELSVDVATVTLAQAAVEPLPRDAPVAEVKSFVGHAKLIGVLTLFSRLLGLGREMVAGHYLGTGLVASAFTVAFTIPNLFRKLFGEGALSAAFIPLYAQAVKDEVAAAIAVDGASASGRIGAASVSRSIDSSRAPSPVPPAPPSAAAFAAASINLLVVLLAGITLIGEAVIFAMIRLGGDLRPDRLLTLRLTAIMLPYVLLICSTAILGGILQVHRRFGAPAAAPLVLNGCHIAVVLLGAWILGLSPRRTDPARAAELQVTLCYWLAFFVLVAGALQAAVLWPSLRAVGFRIRPVLGFWTPMVRKMIRLTIPVAIGAGVLQLSVLLDKALSTLLMQGTDDVGRVVTHFTLLGHVFRYPLAAGAPARLNLAQYLYQFPLGVFAIALATAIFPSLSADALDADGAKFRAVLRDGILATLWEGIPASIGLILIREPAVRLLFQHGLVSAGDAALIARSVGWYAGGIWAFSLLQIISRGYYAVHDTLTPLVMSIINIVVNLVVEIPLLWVPWLGEAGMAVGTLVSFVLQAFVMLYLLDRRVGRIGLGQLVRPIGKILLAAAVMGAAVALVRISPLYPAASNRPAWMVQLSLLMSVGALTYLGMSHWLGMDTLHHLIPRRLRLRRRRNRS